MTLVLDTVRSLIPPGSKLSPSGWLSFNAPCCHHRGHGTDTKKRGGIYFDTGVIYHCFNCGFSTGWQPGSIFHDKIRTLCSWLGASDDEIKKLVFEAMKTESLDYQPSTFQTSIKFEEKKLPDNSKPIKVWIEENDAEHQEHLSEVVEYLMNRGFDPCDDNFWWTPEIGFRDRVIIPFYYQGKLSGYTGRKIKKGNPKYISDQHPQFVFNYDNQHQERKYVLVTEGPFDAISVDGVALLTNDISDQQARIINNLSAEIIVIPDQDKAGLNLIKRAMDLDWSVAFPNWGAGIKDCADAVNKYGKLFVIVDAIKTAQKGKIKIKIAMNNLESRLDDA